MRTMRNLLLLFSCASIPALAAQVKLLNTTLIGVDNPSANQEFFGGIPYAVAPVGNRRLRPPILKLSPGGSSFNASSFGPVCIQPDVFGFGPNPFPFSEDCLTLNVFRPSGLSANSKLPVMVWIHGGAFIIGSSNEYVATPLVSRSIARGTPIIVVTINYRLGPLGFAAGAEVTAGNVLNLGIKDQFIALEWVKRNIGAFGGDPSKVTVFGESAGAMSIGVLYLSPNRLENLVRGAILESGSAGSPIPLPPTSSRYQDVWDTFSNAVPGCSAGPQSLACIRDANLTSEGILQSINVVMATFTQNNIPWTPTLDSGSDAVFPDYASKRYTAGKFARVPFIAGGNLDEGTLFTPLTVASSQTVHDNIVTNYSTSPADAALLSAAADKLLQLYPDDPSRGSPFNTGNETFGLSSQFKRGSALTGDLVWHSPRRMWSQTAAKASLKNYAYHFTGPILPLLPPFFGVAHGQEIPFVFNELPAAVATPEQLELSNQISDYWISFAATKDPNDGKGTQRPTWSQYTTSDPALLDLHAGSPTLVKDNYRAEQIAFINRNPVLFKH